MNRAGQILAASCLFVAVAIIVGLCSCKPACTVIDVAHEACVIIPLIGADGGVQEIKVSGPEAMKYLSTGRVGAERCPK